jgi:hypothetical protein
LRPRATMPPIGGDAVLLGQGSPMGAGGGSEGGAPFYVHPSRYSAISNT